MRGRHSRTLPRHLTILAVKLVFSVHCLMSSNLMGADSSDTKPLEPEIAPASPEAAAAVNAIRIPQGWKIELFAAEPLVANIVAFDIDHRGRFYVCESFRQNRGVTDNRGHDEQWLLADLAAKTVQDRIDYHKRLLGEAAITYSQHDDRIRRVSDTDGDGVADKSTVFANGFNHLEEGTGAGVLVRGSEVLYTCIPKLWKLTDEDDDGVSDQRTTLSDGYGVRVAFRGHDLHGAILGPDGRVYFSIGDRGYHITTNEGRILSDPASGAIFRCELDGSELEVYARGLRNPQELAFNDVGDLFSVDNNSDSGDKARIVHLLEDGDSGWRMHYQYLADRGPFNREKIWEPLHDEQPAFIVPPIANFTDGPSGLAFYPGSGFGDQLKNKFLICDFRGGASNSGIRSFELSPQGATYSLATDDQPIWTCLATDVAFGPDGSLYVSDWVDGWDGLGKGRVYRITDPKHSDSPIVAEVQSVLAQDWTQSSSAELTANLSHVDRRVRLESQWELARRGDAESLVSVARDADVPAVARLHAVWGVGQIIRTDTEYKPKGLDVLRPLLGDRDASIVAAVADIAGQTGDQKAASQLKSIVGAPKVDSRTRYFAIRALGKLKVSEAIDDVLRVLAVQKNADYALRHAGISFLADAVKPTQIAMLSKHPDANVRRAAVCALRRLESGAVKEFLADSDPLVVAEAGRAIHDRSIGAGTNALAKLIKNPVSDSELTRRILNANFRIGSAESANSLANYATRGEHAAEMRLDALGMLADWSRPDPRDRVLGRFKPLPERDSQFAVAALEPKIDLLMTAPEAIRQKTIEVAAELGIKKIAGELEKELADTVKSPQAKSVALSALSKLNSAAAVKFARDVPLDPPNELALAALKVLAIYDAKASFGRFTSAVASSDRSVRQLGWDVLAKIKTPEASAVIADGVKRYIGGDLPSDVRLNVLDAAEGRLEESLSTELAQHREKLAASDPLGAWLDSLNGGDIDRGSKLFFEKTELSCVRCHKVDRVGGEVGPNLTTIGKQRDRRYLLESICLPNAQIAKGFETAQILDIDGQTLSGIVKAETDDYVELVLADGSQKRILQDDIEARKKGNSSMPADLVKFIKPRELRDLVAYLSSLQVDPRADDDVE